MVTKRKDIVTSKIFDRESLIRISIDKNGATRIDYKYNLGGRGIYVHPESISKGIERNIIYKNIKRFKGTFDDIKDDLVKEIK